jgi:hypothetical protein
VAEVNIGEERKLNADTSKMNREVTAEEQYKQATGLEVRGAVPIIDQPEQERHIGCRQHVCVWTPIYGPHFVKDKVYYGGILA